jgi:histidyl-tRNA synthetase
MTVAIDKLDKIGKEGVEKELREKGLSEKAIAQIQPLFDLHGTTEEKLSKMREFLAGSDIGQRGVEELEFVVNEINELGLRTAKLEFDVTLARGLNYYTGAIFEVKANGVNMGSICGGGRYDDLTGIFGMPGMSGVGISFGADRIYDVLNELDLFPSEASDQLDLLFVNFGEKEARICRQYIRDARANGIACELYPESAKMKKQMKYANDRNVNFVAMIGEEELASGLILLKDMSSGEQEELSPEELIQKLKK